MKQMLYKPSYFFIRSNGEFVRINYNDVLYIEGCKNYIRLVTHAKNFLILSTIKLIEDQLTGHPFCRIHRSFIVAVPHVLSFDQHSVNVGSRTIPLGDRYRGKLRSMITVLGGDNRANQNETEMNTFSGSIPEISETPLQ
jgi:DNA-binding LytR/AlgR family response regulator